MSTAWAFAGDAALVTGAASGIGRATAGALYDAGLQVLILDRDGAAAAAVCAELGDRARFHEADIADPEQTEAAVTALTGDGTLSYVVNCAGIHHPAGVDELTAADWTRMLDVNLVGAFNVSRAAARHLRSAPAPAIVNITSVESTRVVALVNPHSTPHYAAAKAGLEMLTKSLAHEFAPAGIRVNAIAPGPVETPMVRDAHSGATGLPPAFASHLMIKRYAKPAELAAAICFLLSDSASYITATTLNVDGGYTAL